MYLTCIRNILSANREDIHLFFFQTENIGLNKSAWELYPISDTRLGAERAVDGLYSDLSAAGRQCVISANFKSTAEWRVDLGRIHIISHIVIHYRTEHIAIDSSIFLKRFQFK